MYAHCFGCCFKTNAKNILSSLCQGFFHSDLITKGGGGGGCVFFPPKQDLVPKQTFIPKQDFTSNQRVDPKARFDIKVRFGLRAEFDPKVRFSPKAEFDPKTNMTGGGEEKKCVLGVGTGCLGCEIVLLGLDPHMRGDQISMPSCIHVASLFLCCQVY